MNIVFLDCAVVNPGDISWEPIRALGKFSFYERTEPEQVINRIGEAEAVITDSVPIIREVMESCPNLEFIGVAATGYNHVDLIAAEELNIAVCNVPSYSSDSVSQHAIGLLLAVTNQIGVYNRAVSDGEWQNSRDYAFIKSPITLLSGKSIGIIGYGNIGKKVAAIAEALGMKINIYSQNPMATINSDVVSLHCPLTGNNHRMIDRAFIEQMKEGAVLINTARGGLVDEEALAEALRSGKLAGAGLDVLTEEPPKSGSPLIGLPNCYITPHIAFIPVEIRKIVCDTCADNIRSFLSGERLNRVV